MMSDDENDPDYEPSIASSESTDDECNTNGYCEITKSQEEQLRKLKELGELKTEDILEIQMLEQLIKSSSMTEQQKYQTGKCLEMLINLSNAYVNSYVNKKQ
tara:strand:+ start:4188 stop:4493 length:306 start_codon:yes stop_codon:yes gene_type:complete